MARNYPALSKYNVATMLVKTKLSVLMTVTEDWSNNENYNGFGVLIKLEKIYLHLDAK